MPANYSTNIVYLSKAQYQELLTNQTITVNGTTVTYNENDIYVTPQAEPITDVKINGTSIGANGIANIPLANGSTYGIMKVSNYNGVEVRSSDGQLTVIRATDNDIKASNQAYKPITPSSQDKAVFYGLAKVAGHDEKNSTESLGTYTDGAKASIQNMLGITSLLSTEESSTATAAHAINSTFMMDGKLHRATAAIAIGDAVEVGTNCEVVKADEVFVKNTDYATSASAGVVKVESPNAGTYGIRTWSTTHPLLTINSADSRMIQDGGATMATAMYRPITSNHQHESVFYGLSKVAGVDLANETVTLGTYPETSKTAIRSLIGAAGKNDIVKQYDGTLTYQKGDFCKYEDKIYFAKTNISTAEEWNSEHWTETTLIGYASSTLQKPGLVGITPLWSGVNIDNTGALYLNMPNDALIKAGTDAHRAILIAKQHMAVFYGLAKAAGDTTQSISSNAVGTYTDDAKAAIRTMLGAGTPLDVQINSTSIVSSGIANIPIAGNNSLGVIAINSTLGIMKGQGDALKIYAAVASEIKEGTNTVKPIVPSTQDTAIYYGLSKLAGVDLASETVTVGTYPTASKTAIRNMLGATSSNVIAVQDEQPTDSDTKVWLPETEAQGIQVPTMEDLGNYVQKTDYATTSNYGIVKLGSNTITGLKTNASTNVLMIDCAGSSHIKTGINYVMPITPYYQHESVFYGLAKAAGDTTQSISTNAVGTYTSEASAAIRSMLGAVGDVQVNGNSIVNNGVATIPLAENVQNGTPGLVKVYWGGLYIDNNGYLKINPATSTEIKNATASYVTISPLKQHESVFYGLATAAGDTTQKTSDNTVGTYTIEAKAAIHTMLGIDPVSIAAQVDIPLVETVTGTTPSITGQPNVRYVCGEVSTLSLTPPASGSMDVIFESGSTATVLTVPNTVKWPAWFDATSLEADTTYEILITDGIYGSVMTWAT